MVKKEAVTITFGLTPKSRTRLEELAAAFGLFWGNKPSINRLLEAIGSGKIDLQNKKDSQTEISTDPTTTQLLQLINQRQAFRLTYESPSGKLQNHLCLYAELMELENKTYLAAYCPESAGASREIPELVNNWLFRIDRLQGAALVPVANCWHSTGLDFCSARFLLKSGLAFSYEPHPHDVSQEWIDIEGKTSKLLTRYIYFGWFFRREILGYGSSVEILEPTSLREMVRHELQKSLIMYQQ